MSVGYHAVGWNRQKRIYDLTLAAAIVGYLTIFAGVTVWLHPEATAETIVIRAFGTAAFVVLHVALAIGPLCRIDRRFLPLLYNRRHLGVTMFLLALVHGGLSVFQFHALGVLDPFVSLLVSDGSFAGVATMPFQVFGAAALLILFLMAATSHDFWLANLSAPTWKALHMLVYVAYALLIAHVMFGVAQTAGGSSIAGATAIGAVMLGSLHVAAAQRESLHDGGGATSGSAPQWIDVCSVDDIREDRARIVTLSGERVAIFRYAGKISAVSNVCQHQNGPLGEGRILDGCITCPWHGYQYRPDTGASPPPFKEKIPTFAVRVCDRRVLVDPKPLPAGTRVEPALIA
jgi:methionine sulfoxide reductase heme-binding subunit